MDPWKLEPAHDFDLTLRERLGSERRESGLIETIGHALWWMLVRSYLRLYHRLRVHGLERMPTQPPFILIANHSSHLDALVLAAQVPRRLGDCTFPLAAQDTFFQSRISSAFAALALNALPMRRRHTGRHAIESLRERLVHEQCVFVLFPEGTRSRDGQLQAFKPGIGMLVAGSDVPVVSCYLRGTHEALPPERRWPKPRRIELSIGAPLRFKEVSNDREGWERIAAALQREVERLRHEGIGRSSGSVR
jgi:1-acyl-sn-glycerol-3-phosphate acyltransferase